MNYVKLITASTAIWATLVSVALTMTCGTILAHLKEPAEIKLTSGKGQTVRQKMKLINPKEIRFVWAPIAPMLTGDSVHYEQIAFRWEINQIPRIEAEPARTGSWIISSKEQTGCLIPVECRCSRCGQQIDPDSSRLFRYCPNCGAMMLRGEQDG